MLIPKGLMLGKRVVLNVPENPKLHGSSAIIIGLEDWGARVAVKQAATGQFRALWEEMEVFDEEVAEQVNGIHKEERRDKDCSYTGNECINCGSTKMVRNGTCELCLECGTTTGCS